MNDSNAIPDQIKKFASSTEVSDRAEAIGAKFSLHIDQIGELDAEIRDVLRGHTKPSNFTADVSERLEIEKDIAEQITQEVNKVIFEALKTSMREQTDSPALDTSSIEQAGGFSVEKPSGVDENGENGHTEGMSGTTIQLADRNKILKDIENPPNSAAKGAIKSSDETFTEPLVDQLLANTTARPEEKIVHQAPPPANLPVVEATPAPGGAPSTAATGSSAKPPTTAPPAATNAPTAPQKPKGPDLYREPIK